MANYDEWIKLSCDPVEAHDFHALTNRQAEQFLIRMTEAIPERMRQLEAFVADRRPRWRPDFSETAFLNLCEVFAESVETVPRTDDQIKADLELQRRVQPEILELLGENVRDWELSDQSLSLAYDAGIYFGQDLMSKEPRLHWRVDTRRCATLHHPVLSGARPGRRTPFILGCPMDIFLTTAFGVASMQPRSVSMSVVYQEWIEDIRDYQNEGR